MRIRITKDLVGVLDGIDLSKFVVGAIYQVGTTLGNYLLAEGAATPVLDDEPGLVLPLNHPIAERIKPRLTGAEAADREPRKKR